jgi:hypothetical protein
MQGQALGRAGPCLVLFYLLEIRMFAVNRMRDCLQAPYDREDLQQQPEDAMGAGVLYFALIPFAML